MSGRTDSHEIGTGARPTNSKRSHIPALAHPSGHGPVLH
jgi:hypothetical protein